ncbi:MAG: site-2 protease family protein [bacterium]
MPDPQDRNVLDVEYDPATGQYVVVRPKRRIPWMHIVLFVLTIVTTCSVSIAYGLAIMTILLAHEMGHYLVARRYGVRASLPYFIPMPLSPMGTMGAVITMQARIPNRTILFDIGIAGPLAGLVVTIPAILIGLTLSTTVPASETAPGGALLGGSLLFSFLSDLMTGGAGSATDRVVVLHPIALAGWFGLFVTALNLLPVSQLDGGHVLYGLLGERSRRVATAVYAGFLAMAIISHRQWLPFAILILLMRPSHPPTLDTVTPLSRGRRILAFVAFILFVISFSPDPFREG